MKASELVEELNAMIVKDGDLEVKLPQVGGDEGEEIYWNAMISSVLVEKDNKSGRRFILIY